METRVLVLPFIGCVTLGELLSLSVPHSPYLYNWDNKSINLKLQRFNDDSV